MRTVKGIAETLQRCLFSYEVCFEKGKVVLYVNTDKQKAELVKSLGKNLKSRKGVQLFSSPGIVDKSGVVHGGEIKIVTDKKLGECGELVTKGKWSIIVDGYGIGISDQCNVDRPVIYGGVRVGFDKPERIPKGIYEEFMRLVRLGVLRNRSDRKHKDIF